MNGRQDIERQRQDFQPQEDGHKVGGRRHQHHAADGKEQQRVVFAVLGDALALDVARREQHRQEARAEDHQITEERQPVISDHAQKGWLAIANDVERDGGRQATGQRQQCEERQPAFAPGGRQQVGDHQQQAASGNDEFRRHSPPVVQVGNKCEWHQAPRSETRTATCVRHGCSGRSVEYERRWQVAARWSFARRATG